MGGQVRRETPRVEGRRARGDRLVRGDAQTDGIRRGAGRENEQTDGSAIRGYGLVQQRGSDGYARPDSVRPLGRNGTFEALRLGPLGDSGRPIRLQGRPRADRRGTHRAAENPSSLRPPPLRHEGSAGGRGADRRRDGELAPDPDGEPDQPRGEGRNDPDAGRRRGEQRPKRFSRLDPLGEGREPPRVARLDHRRVSGFRALGGLETNHLGRLGDRRGVREVLAGRREGDRRRVPEYRRRAQMGDRELDRPRRRALPPAVLRRREGDRPRRPRRRRGRDRRPDRRLAEGVAGSEEHSLGRVLGDMGTRPVYDRPGAGGAIEDRRRREERPRRRVAVRRRDRQRRGR